MFRIYLVLLIVLATALSACGSDITIDAQSVDKITVRFNDSSTPPQFHRSWSVTVTNGRYEASVDSYGDPEATTTGTIDDATIATFLEELTQLGSAPDLDTTCDGNSSYYFQLQDASSTQLFETSSGCGSDARAWNTDAAAVADLLASAVDLGPLYNQVDAALDE